MIVVSVLDQAHVVLVVAVPAHPDVVGQRRQLGEVIGGQGHCCPRRRSRRSAPCAGCRRWNDPGSRRSSQASATCPAVAFLALANCFTRVTSAWLLFLFSPVNLGMVVRTSPAPKDVAASTVAVRKPLPSGLNDTKPKTTRPDRVSGSAREGDR